jgi:broad specificity phosphatase PhoE
VVTALLAAALLGQLDGGARDELSPAMRLVGLTSERESVEELLDDGRHWRFGTRDQGPVHVWRPRAYQASSAALILYVHGFYTDVDAAMLEHNLASQFRDSGRNALFIVPEARSARGDAVLWPRLGDLLDEVRRRVRVPWPKGPVVVVGHSGAYRTIASWLSHAPLAQVVLIDGLYGNDDDFKQWLAAPAAPSPRQLVLVGFDTQSKVEAFLLRHPFGVRLDTIPYLYDELPPAARRAPLLSLQSERFDHMALVTSGRLVPWLLHALR